MANLKLYRTFFMPTIVGVVGLSILWLDSISRYASHRPGKDYQQIVSRLGELTQPAPTYSPAAVVRIQLDGLSDAEDSLGVMQCMVFASPANQLVTGPLDRFGRMVRQPPYSALSQADAVLVGAPTVVEGRARVLVSALAGETLHSFIWVLSKQKEGQFRDCWLTDAVFFVRSSEGFSPVPPALPGSSESPHTA